MLGRRQRLLAAGALWGTDVWELGVTVWPPPRQNPFLLQEAHPQTPWAALRAGTAPEASSDSICAA